MASLTHPRRGPTTTDWGLFIARVALGVIFFAHGSQKLWGWFGGHGMSATVAAFQGMGIPPYLTWLAAIAEFFGGIAVMIGLFSRFAGLALAIDMLVAIFKVHVHNGFFSAPQGGGFEYPMALCALALLIMLAGPGRIAVVGEDIRPVSRRAFA